MRRRNCYFPAFRQICDIAIRFSDPDLFKKTNILGVFAVYMENPAYSDGNTSVLAIC